MYKLKIINFKPYEYEIFEKELNQLGEQGYKTDDLSLITIFKKTNKKYKYKIDFYIPEGKTRNEKYISKQKFIDPYLDDEYEAIYNKNQMYVFIGEKDSKIQLDFKKRKDFINDKKTFRLLNYFVASVIISLTFLVISAFSITIDTFLSYGMTFVYGGIVLGCLTMIYRCFCNMYFTNQLHKKIQEKNNKLPYILLNKLRKIYGIAVIITALFILGGLLEDSIQTKPFSTQEHPILLLKDIGITQKTEISNQQKASFTVPHSYTSLEIAEDKTAIYIKEYQLRNEKAATKLMNDLSKHPEQYYCGTVQSKNSILYGYVGEDLATLIIQNKDQVILVSPDFDLTDKQIEAIIQFYK